MKICGTFVQGPCRVARPEGLADGVRLIRSRGDDHKRCRAAARPDRNAAAKVLAFRTDFWRREPQPGVKRSGTAEDCGAGQYQAARVPGEMINDLFLARAHVCRHCVADIWPAGS